MLIYELSVYSCNHMEFYKDPINKRSCCLDFKWIPRIISYYLVHLGNPRLIPALTPAWNLHFLDATDKFRVESGHRWSSRRWIGCGGRGELLWPHGVSYPALLSSWDLLASGVRPSLLGPLISRALPRRSFTTLSFPVCCLLVLC